MVNRLTNTHYQKSEKYHAVVDKSILGDQGDQVVISLRLDHLNNIIKTAGYQIHKKSCFLIASI